MTTRVWPTHPSAGRTRVVTAEVKGAPPGATRGQPVVNGLQAAARDGIAVSETETLTIEAAGEEVLEVVLADLPGG